MSGPRRHLLVVSFSHVMDAIKPGACGDLFIPWLAHVGNIVFIVGTLALDLSNVRMWMLSNHCYFQEDPRIKVACGKA